MSVANPIISSIDGENRRIYLAQGVTEFFPIEDLYHEYRNRRRLDTDGLRKWEPLLRAEGNVPKGAGAFTPRYVVLLLGTKIIPYDEPDTLSQLGDMITDDPDTDPEIYDISQLTTAKTIFIQPSEAEVIQLNSKTIENSSFNEGVMIDVDNLTGKAKPGTEFPAGTPEQPVDNLNDLRSILNARGLIKVYVVGDLDIDDDKEWMRIQFFGESSIMSQIDIYSGADVFNSQFFNATITGELDGLTQIEGCVINGLDFVNGYVFNCSIGPATISVEAGATANIFNCFSAVPGASTPDFDLNGTGVLALRNYNGGGRITNYNGAGSHSIDLNSGQIKMDPNTVTSGTFIVRGTGKLIDDSTGEIIETGTWNGGVTIVNELVQGITIEKIKDILEADVIPQPDKFRLLHKISKAILVEKNASTSQDNGLTTLTEP